MKIIRYITLIFVFGVALWSCNDNYLDVRDEKTGIDNQQLYRRYSSFQQVLWEAYSCLPDGFSELWREGATDLAESTSGTSISQDFNNGAWDQFRNPDDVWTKNYKGIDVANRLLANKDKVDFGYLLAQCTPSDSTPYKNAANNVKFSAGEALFLKAFFYFELIKRYGGVPIINKPLDYNDPTTWKDLPRNSLDECVKHIVILCDSAAKIIPATMSAYAWYGDGRVTRGAILFLKAKTLLYAASPLFKANGTTATWADAASAANDVINFSKTNGNLYNLNSSYSGLFGSSNSTLAEVIFKRRYGNINWMEYNQFPISYLGSNGMSITPTQNLVDKYEVGNATASVPFSWSNPAHAAAPYTNRDTRFAATVLYNMEVYKGDTIKTYETGKDGQPRVNASRTGYYLNKWVISSIDLVNNTSAAHTWIYYRFADVYLMYAEAALNAYGASVDPDGAGTNYTLTALQAINLVRARAKVQNLAASALDQAAIEKERSCEFAFEDSRYWDVRRWGKGTTYFNAPVNKIKITRVSGSVFTYEVSKLEDRVFTQKMDWYPIPQSEISQTNWSQNPLW